MQSGHGKTCGTESDFAKKDLLRLSLGAAGALNAGVLSLVKLLYRLWMLSFYGAGGSLSIQAWRGCCPESAGSILR